MSDYWEYNRCYEIPRNFALWAGLGMLGATAHRKLLYLHGDIEIHATLYVGLIGSQGSSKSTACGFARDFFRSACPDSKIGPSRSTPESLAKIMNEDKFERQFKDWNGDTVLVRPYAFFINEFKNFVGRSPFDMVTFLTDIYDTKAYDASTIARGVEFILNPAINIIMCETPEWFSNNIKGDIITGGIMRRFVLVYETKETDPIPNPIVTPEAFAAKARVIDRLRDVFSLSGSYKWVPHAQNVLFDKWYRHNHTRWSTEGNQAMRGYLRSKHVQLFKVMMLLDVCSDKPMFLFTGDLLDHGLALLDSIERNMPKLSLAAGRNEMMGSYLRALDLLETAGGWMPEKQLKRHLETDMDGTQIYHALKHLEDTDQIVKALFGIENPDKKIVERWMICLPWKFAQVKKQPSGT